jgi:cytoskeleton protein RodZ
MNEPSPIILSAPDAGSRSAGDLLRAARESQGVTLERLASTIKVTPAKLEDLEQGRYDRLPDPNFTRALAMTICRALKVDPTEILAALPAAKAIPLVSDRPPLNQPFKESRGGSPLFDKQMDLSALLSLKWLAPGLLLLGALVIYALPDSVDVPGWFRHAFAPAEHHAEVAAANVPAVVPAPASNPVDEASSPAEPPPPLMDPAASGEVVPSEAPSAPQRATSAPTKAGAHPLVLDATDAAASAPVPPSTPKPVSMAPAASSALVSAYVDPRLVKSQALPARVAASASTVSTPPAASAVAVAAIGPVSAMVLEAQQGSWVEVKDAKGNTLLSRHVQSGERVPVEGAVPLKLVIGNAPGVHLSFRGQGVDLARYTQSNVARLELK